MLKSLKYILMGIGIGFIVAFFWINHPLMYSDQAADPQFVIDNGTLGTEDAMHSDGLNQSDYARGEEHQKYGSGKQEYADENAILFRVLPGMTSSEVGTALSHYKIIDDAVQFDQIIVELGLDKTIYAGEYTLEKGMDIYQIISIITGTEI